MKTLTLTLLLAASHALVAGTCAYPFAGLENAGASDIAVPLLLEEGNNGFTYQGFATNDGSDLRVADSNGTVLPHEIDVWNPSGRSIVWVRVPELSAATALTLSWGDANAAAAEGHVWPKAEVVMHFTGDEPQDTSPSAWTVSNFTEAQSRTDGPVGESRRFFGAPSNPRLHNSSVTLSKGTIDSFTISFWWKADVIGGANQYLFQLFSTHNAITREITAYMTNTGRMSLYSQGQDGTVLNATSAAVPDSQWHHYAFSYNGNTFCIYIDGHLAAQKTQTTSMDTAGRTWQMSFGSSRTPGAPASGSIDEFRFETVARDAAYIRTQCELESKIRYASVASVTVTYPDVAVPAEAPLAEFPLFVPIRRVDAGISADSPLLAAIMAGSCEVVPAGGNVKYPYEIEYGYADGMNAAGLWVRVPSFSRETALAVRMPRSHYSPAAQTPSAGVWDGDGYLVVNHILPTGARTDSAHGFHFTPSNTARTDWSLYSPVADGPTGPYAALRGGTTTVARVSSATVSGASLTNVYTISWWMQQERFSTLTTRDPAMYIMFLGYSTDTKQRAVMVGGSNGAHTIYLFPDTPRGCGMQVPDEGWHHYAYVCDGATIAKYVDGVLQSGTPAAYDFKMPEFSSKTVAIGNSAAGAQVGVAGFVGGIDEVRIENVVRSAEWLAASYATQLAYRNGVGYGHAPEFAKDVAVEENGTALTFTAKLSCRTTAACHFCWGPSDGGDNRDSWANVIALGEHGDGPVSSVLTGIAEGEKVYGRFFAANARGADSTRSMLVRRDMEDRCKAPVTVRYSGSETLTNFPVAIRFPATSGLPRSAQRLKILCGGRSLPFEVETWNPAGESVVWVRLPLLAADTTLLATWRNTKADDGSPWSAAEVWGGDFKRVYHFGDGMCDSAAGDNLVMSSATIAGAGRIGGGVSFASAGAELSGGNAKDFNDFAGGFTFSLWAKLEAGGYQRLASFSRDSYAFTVNYGSNTVDALSLGLEGFYLTPKSGQAGGFNATLGVDALVERSAISRPDAEWHQYAWTSDGRWLRMYRDGVCVSQVLMPMTLGSDIPGIRRMTAAFGGSSALRYCGLLDEVRVARKPRSAGWIAAEYANLSGNMVEVGDTVKPGIQLIFR